jgi:hypothetical protein
MLSTEHLLKLLTHSWLLEMRPAGCSVQLCTNIMVCTFPVAWEELGWGLWTGILSGWRAGPQCYRPGWQRQYIAQLPITPTFRNGTVNKLCSGPGRKAGVHWEV